MPLDDRSAKMEFALGSTYDQLKDNKKAIAAYQRALAADPDNLDAERALGQSLLNDNQLEEALKIYQDISAGDPQDPQAYLRISEIERRQGKYEQSLATLKKAKALVKDSLEISYNEALLYDSLGRYDDAVQILEKLVTRPRTRTINTPTWRRTTAPFSLIGWPTSTASRTRLSSPSIPATR